MIFGLMHLLCLLVTPYNETKSILQSLKFQHNQLRQKEKYVGFGFHTCKERVVGRDFSFLQFYFTLRLMGKNLMLIILLLKWI